MAFTVVFFTKGVFTKDPILKYKGGDIHAFRNLDPDTWSYFEAIGLIQEVDSSVQADNVRLWWKPSNGTLEVDLKALRVDKDAADLLKNALGSTSEVEIYVEYNVNKDTEVGGPVCLAHEVGECSNKDKGKGVADAEEVREDSSDGDSSDGDSVKGIHFDDSEEERVREIDDGFDEHEVPIEVPTGTNVGSKNNQKSLTKFPTRHFDGEEDESNTFVPLVVDAVHDIDDEYLTEELDSASDSSCDGDPKPKTIRFHPDDMCKDFKFSVGMEFSSLKHFKDAVLEHNVLMGRQVKYAKNDRQRVRIECKFNDICEYTVLVSRVVRTTTYKVKTLRPKHTCGRVFANKNAKASWVAKEMVERMKNNHKLKINDVISDIRTRFSTQITFSTAFKARQIARQIVDGDSDKQYSLLWSYSAELKRASPGNTCKLQLERPTPNLQPRFGRYYICFDGCKKALKTACRPFIGVDGCHLKNKYGGQLLIVVGRGPNDQYLPLAFAVVETETKDTWNWFLTLLLEDIGDATTNKWTFISDQQKGLVATFEELLPGTEHRFCLRHLYANMKKKFGGGTLIKDLMMAAAKSTYFEAWEDKMLQLKEVDAKAYEWLIAHPTKTWCKHAFPFYSRCDVLMNNLSESFNATILLQRDKPIITMFEWIRAYLMGRFASLREKVRKYKGDVMPKPRKRLDREIEMSGNWFATYAGELKFEVTHSTVIDKFVVDLQKHSCSCNFWELVGIPCRHAVAAIIHKQDDPVMYVHKYFNRQTYIECYDQLITPINGQNKWPKTDYPEVLPPHYKRGPGRPKKLRRREPDEPQNPTKWKRTHTTNRCKRCLQYGHNARTCKNPNVGNSNSHTETNLESEHPSAHGFVDTQHLPTQASQTAAPKKRGRPKGTKSTAMPKESTKKKTKTVTAKPKEPTKKKTKTVVGVTENPMNEVEASTGLTRIHQDQIDPEYMASVLFDDEEYQGLKDLNETVLTANQTHAIPKINKTIQKLVQGLVENLAAEKAASQKSDLGDGDSPRT